jgi:allantoicase
VTEFLHLPDLASRLLGGGVVACNDEFFAPADRLVEPSDPQFTPKTFGAKGQVYDGWETRRRRTPGFDWAIVRLGAPGVVHGVMIDTAWFTGNYPPYASVDGCAMHGYPSPEELSAADWVELVAKQPLLGDSANLFDVHVTDRVTHVRLNIFPDGGVARLRVHGEAVFDRALLVGGLVDLGAMEHGGRVVDCSNMFYGHPNNMLLPGHARTMGEGWETARRRDDGNDWVLVQLGLPGTVHLVELDTSHFKGNAPGSAELTGFDPDGNAFVILPRTRLQPDTRHRLPIEPIAEATRVRLDIYPDGGMARLRLFGHPRPLAS